MVEHPRTILCMAILCSCNIMRHHQSLLLRALHDYYRCRCSCLYIELAGTVVDH